MTVAIPLTSCLLFRDASNEVYNVFILKHFNKEICSEKYEKYEKETSSTCSKTCTCQFRLHFKKPICSSKDVLLNRLKTSLVQVNIHNSSVCRILSIGSAKSHLL